MVSLPRSLRGFTNWSNKDIQRTQKVNLLPMLFSMKENILLDHFTFSNILSLSCSCYLIKLTFLPMLIISRDQKSITIAM